MPTLIAQAKLRQATRLTVVDGTLSASLTSAITITCIGAKVKRTIIDLETVSNISLTTEKLFRIGFTNTAQPGNFQRGQRYQITTLGNANYNLIADTTGVSYQVGSVFTAANSGAVVPQVSGRAMLLNNLTVSTLTCKFPTYIRIDLEALGMDSYEGQDCIMQLDEGVVIQGNYPGSEFTPNPREDSFMTFRIPKYFRSQLASSVSSSALALRIKQLASSLQSAVSLSAFAQLNPGKFAALVFSLGSMTTLVGRTTRTSAAFTAASTVFAQFGLAKFGQLSLTSQFSSSLTSLFSRIRFADSTMSNIISVVCTPYQFEGIVLTMSPFATVTANVTRIEMTYNLSAVTSISVANTRLKFGVAAMQTVTSTTAIGNRVGLAQANLAVQSSVSCIGNKPMVIKSNGAGTFGLYGTVNATIQWPDGTETVATTPGSYSYDAGAVGSGIITIRGTVQKYGPGPDNATYAHNSASVYSFGDLPITHLDYAFSGVNFGQDSFVPAKLPTTITSLRGLFYGASQYRGRIVGDGYTSSGFGNADQWDVSNVTDMSFMFYQNLNLTEGSGSGTGVQYWDTSNVTTMESMFESTSIGLTISNWNTSSLTNIKNFMKSNVTSLYGQVLNWNVSNVTNMEGAFQSAQIGGSTIMPTSFAAWNTSSATNMKNMFAFSTPEGGVVSGFSNWNTSNVTNMEGMFRSVRISTQAAGRLDNWDTGNVTNMISMFQDVSATFLNNSSQDLRGWCVTHIATEPTNFTSASAWTYRPVWGTCP